MEERYFVASNSSEGFCSYYENAFNIENFTRIYAIKGGSGTGKATFMRTVARKAEERGFSVRYIYCSSDAESLDGIIIKEMKLALLDGTAPHIYEPHLIGAVDSIIDLGAFLDEKRLSPRRDDIEIASREKQRGFERAYGCLGAYKTLSKNVESLVLPALKHEKMRSFARRFTDSMDIGDGREENLLVRSIGMRGLCSFDTYFERAGVYYEISDYFETAHFLMKELYSLAVARQIGRSISNNPIITSRIDAMSLTDSHLTFEIGNGMSEGARVINMRRFLNPSYIADIRQDYRAIVRVRDETLHLALCEFENIKKYHFILEEIYGSAMDFSAKEQFTYEFCHKIFQNN